MTKSTGSRENGDPRHSPLLSETQRVLDRQVQIVQEQQSQATRIIRVALTIGGLLLTLVSILVSSPFFSQGFSLVSFELISLSTLGVLILGTYAALFLLLIFGNVFASALIVLSPESGGTSLLRDNPLRQIISYYRRTFLPAPLSNILSVKVARDGMTLRAGIDSDEVSRILEEANSNEKARKEIVEYNQGCIRGNEELIEDNRRRLSQIYGIGVVTIFIFISASLVLLSATFIELLPS